MRTVPAVLSALASLLSTTDAHAVNWAEKAVGLEREALQSPGFTWRLLQGTHCRVHYLPGTFVARHVAALSRSADSAVERALATLDVGQYERPLDVFYVGSRDEMESLVGLHVTGFADWESSSVFLVCNDQWRSFDLHEITHVLSYSLWGDAAEPYLWIREGLAVGTDGRCRDNDVKSLAAEFLRRGELPGVLDLMYRFPEQGEMPAYLGSGSLVAFILDRYGIDAVRELWQRGGGAMEQILGVTPETLDKEWRAELDTVEGRPTDDEWKTVIDVGCG